MNEILQKLHLFVAIYMVGLITFVQFVHYSLFLKLNEDKVFFQYHRAHTRKTLWVTAPFMLLELILAIFFLLTQWGEILWIFNFTMVAATWLSTLFLQMPLHQKLEKANHESLKRQLIYSDRLRFGAWWLRGLVLVGTMV